MEKLSTKVATLTIQFIKAHKLLQNTLIDVVQFKCIILVQQYILVINL